LFYELHTAISRISIAGTEPIMKALTVFSDKAKKGIITLLALFAGIVSLFGTLLENHIRL
jgi:hypothetical protein